MWPFYKLGVWWPTTSRLPSSARRETTDMPPTPSNVSAAMPVADLARPFLILFALSSLVCLPVLGHPVPYLDGAFQIMSGSVDFWFNNARPLAVVLLKSLQGSAIITDTSPVTLLLALALLAALLTFSMRYLSSEQSVWTLTVAMAVLLNPFNVQPMLYVFDSLPILLSIGLGFLGCMPLASRPGLQWVSSVLCFLGSLCLYQTGINHSIIVLILLTAHALLTPQPERDSRLRNVCVAIAGLIFSVLAYKVLVIPGFITDHYNLQRGALVSFDAVGFGQVATNASALGQAIHSAYPGITLAPVLLIFLAGLVASWKLAFTSLSPNRTRGSGYLVASFFLIAPWAVALAIEGVVLPLRAVEFAPRLFTAFGTALLFNLLIACQVFPRLRPLLLGVLILHLVFTANFMAAAFRAIVHQHDFDINLATGLRADLSRLDKDAFKMIAVVGSSPVAPLSRPAYARYPMLASLMHVAFRENFNFEYYALMQPLMISIPMGLTTPAVKAYQPDSVLAANCIYRLYRFENALVLDFNTPNCPEIVPFAPFPVPGA